MWEFVIFVCWFEVCRTSKLLLGKVLILFVRSRYCGELNRGLQNLEAFFEKGFNFVSAKPPLRRAESRFAKPRNFPERETVLFFSLVRKEPKVPQRFATLDLLETWSPCSRPFAILPVSAVSDAQKLATGNFLHVRACFCGTFCTPQKVPIRSLAGSFEVLQTSIQLAAMAASL